MPFATVITSVAALDLVADEHRVVAIAEDAELLQELLAHHADAAHALNTLDDDGAHVALLQLGLPRLDVVDGQVSDVPVVIDGRDDLGVVGHLDRQRGASVEGFLHREHAGSAVVEGCQLHGILIGLSARVDEEQLVVLIARRLAETGCQLLLEWVLY